MKIAETKCDIVLRALFGNEIWIYVQKFYPIPGYKNMF